MCYSIPHSYSKFTLFLFIGLFLLSYVQFLFFPPLPSLRYLLNLLFWVSTQVQPNLWKTREFWSSKLGTLERGKIKREKDNKANNNPILVSVYLSLLSIFHPQMFSFFFSLLSSSNLHHKMECSLGLVWVSCFIQVSFYRALLGYGIFGKNSSPSRALCTW